MTNSKSLGPDAEEATLALPVWTRSPDQPGELHVLDAAGPMVSDPVRAGVMTVMAVVRVRGRRF